MPLAEKAYLAIHVLKLQHEVDMIAQVYQQDDREERYPDRLAKYKSTQHDQLPLTECLQTTVTNPLSHPRRRLAQGQRPTNQLCMKQHCRYHYKRR